jgi:hypothetical protein
MTDINWNIFKVKFNEREPKAFEQLAYFLFCSEFDISTGIFRFKNQTGIETEPITVEDRRIGFQAKYYDTKLADNKDDIIDSLTKAKSKNPDLTTIYLYTNREASESTKKLIKRSQYLTDIEATAVNLEIELVWRVPSHIEHQLSKPVNDYLAEYFFSLGKNIIDFLTEIRDHTQRILLPIQSEISFDGKKIKINRDNLLSEINKATTSIVIIGGDGGSGKTAMIKDLVVQTIDPIYIFKATEFNVHDISEVFKSFGNFTLNDFIEIHKEETNKAVVIDSAEKLADLDFHESFRGFLSTLIKNNWKIIFTTRHSYLDDLCFQFLAIYRLPYHQIIVGNLEPTELKSLAEIYDFKLPNDEKLLGLITNLFYLDEYLAHYKSLDNQTNVSKFRSILWQKKIQNSESKKHNIHIERERCFLKLAKARCDSGYFFVKGDLCNNAIISLLETDEIIKYDSDQDGYFITHDIYEEWALEKLIEREYATIFTNDQFFNNLGTSLPIRRAFRNWLSEKLSVNINEIRPFIEKVFVDNNVPPFWKDELLISVLLSDYSKNFFDIFEKVLFENEKYFLKKIIFLLRIACKEVVNIVKDLPSIDEYLYMYHFTKPKGKGWDISMQFIYNKISEYTQKDLTYILTLLEEWNNNNHRGETTRYAALFALHFYNDNQTNNTEYCGEDFQETLISIMFTGAFEIKQELTCILEELLSSPINDREGAYQDLLESILSAKSESYQLVATLPEHVLKLVDKYWYQPQSERDPLECDGYEIDKYYSIPDLCRNDYFPASAYQTPIFWTIQYSFSKTIEFILNFNNRAVESYVASGYDTTVFEIEVTIDQETKTKQWINTSIWNIYRGSGSIVTPYLMQSYHMALEKYLLDVTKITDKKVIASWLIYMLKNTRSASITAIVTSIVLAYPDELFEVAAILFKNYEFFHYDNLRKFMDSEAETIYAIGSGLNYRNKIHESERLNSCNDPHRKLALENLAVQYQLFKNESITAEESERRRKIIWAIIDQHYAQLSSKETRTEEDNIYKILLARIDSRKMKPTFKKEDAKTIIYLNPELDPELKKISEEAVKDNLDRSKYTSLNLWAVNKFENRPSNGNYPQYDDNPEVVLRETKEIIEVTQNGSNHMFFMFNNATPAFTCYTLIKDFGPNLSAEDLLFCKDIILDFATKPLRENYDYQISDGVEVAVNTLPFLYKLFPEDRKDYDLIMLLVLFDATPIGEYKRICDYGIEAINRNLHKMSSENAKNIFKGFLAFKTNFNEINNPDNFNHLQTYVQRRSRREILEQFMNQYESELVNFSNNEIEYTDIKIGCLKPEILETAFHLIPIDSIDPTHLDFVKSALPVFCSLLKHDNKKKSYEYKDYKLRHRFFKRYAHFVLKRDIADIRKWIKPFVDAFIVSREMADFLQEIISAEDELLTYEVFWIIWDCFYEKIKSASSLGDYTDLNTIIHNYLLAWPWWKKTAKDWPSLREREKLFYAKVTTDFGSNPAVLYAISKFINEIGYNFLHEGIYWISDMFTNHHNLYDVQLDPNTIYYLEIAVRRYIYINRTKLKKDRQSQGKLLVILNFLIEKGSVIGYFLREDIL